MALVFRGMNAGGVDRVKIAEILIKEDPPLLPQVVGGRAFRRGSEVWWGRGGGGGLQQRQERGLSRCRDSDLIFS